MAGEQPKPKEVWFGDDGELRWICAQGGDRVAANFRGECIRRAGQSRERWDAWFATAKRVFPSAAPGDGIPVECAVLYQQNGAVEIYGGNNATAVETANALDGVHIATVTVNVPKSLLSPAVLPDVTASE